MVRTEHQRRNQQQRRKLNHTHYFTTSPNCSSYEKGKREERDLNLFFMSVEKAGLDEKGKQLYIKHIFKRVTPKADYRTKRRHRIQMMRKRVMSSLQQTCWQH